MSPKGFDLFLGQIHIFAEAKQRFSFGDAVDPFAVGQIESESFLSCLEAVRGSEEEHAVVVYPKFKPHIRG